MGEALDIQQNVERIINEAVLRRFSRCINALGTDAKLSAWEYHKKPAALITDIAIKISAIFKIPLSEAAADIAVDIRKIIIIPEKIAEANNIDKIDSSETFRAGHVIKRYISSVNTTASGHIIFMLSKQWLRDGICEMAHSAEYDEKNVQYDKKDIKTVYIYKSEDKIQEYTYADWVFSIKYALTRIDRLFDEISQRFSDSPNARYDTEDIPECLYVISEYLHVLLKQKSIKNNKMAELCRYRAAMTVHELYNGLFLKRCTPDFAKNVVICLRTILTTGIDV